MYTINTTKLHSHESGSKPPMLHNELTSQEKYKNCMIIPSEMNSMITTKNQESMEKIICVRTVVLRRSKGDNGGKVTRFFRSQYSVYTLITPS